MTNKTTIILGIESTAHTFGIGIVKVTSNQKNLHSEPEMQVLANIYNQYKSKDHGMIPEEIIDHHKSCSETVLNEALKTANVSWDQIDYIAYSAGPGIDPILWTGFHIAKKLSETHNKPLIPTNHCAAHLSIGKIINKAKDPAYLYVSGVNTQVIVQEDNKYRIMGETLDNGLGNMLDKLGRILGLGFPAGPDIEKLAKSEKASFIQLPYTVKGMDISFSGLLTKCQQLFERGQATKEQICYSLQETAFAAAAEIAERAMAACNKNELILVGGVGANKRFCQMLETMCNERNAKFFKVPMSLAGDQGAMIAWEGFLRKDNHPEMEVNCKWRTDEV